MMGYEETISTLTEIRDKAVEQKIYTTDMAKYVPMVIGKNKRYVDQIMTIKVANMSFDPSFGFGDSPRSPRHIPTSDTTFVFYNANVGTWMHIATWTEQDVEQTLQMGNFDIIAASVNALKLLWKQVLQETMFMGSKDRRLFGLLNHPGVKTATQELDNTPQGPDDCFKMIVDALLPEYSDNCEGTAVPDTLVVPLEDYMSWGGIIWQGKNKLQFLKEGLAIATGQESFNILPLLYANKQNKTASEYGLDVTKGTYVLYKNDPDTLQMNLPMDLTFKPIYPTHKFYFEQMVMGRCTGTCVLRPKEVMYIKRKDPVSNS